MRYQINEYRLGIKGTWQFISIARLQDPVTRPHEVSDDLESFFWVLLFLVAKCRTPEDVDLSEQMQDVFDQHYGMDDGGITRGGKGKIVCLSGRGDLNPITIDDLVKTPCKDIIEELRSLFDDLYLHVPQTFDGRSRIQGTIRRKREQDENVQNAIKKLQSSEEVLAIINRHLASSWDVDDDRSLYGAQLRRDLEASRGRRKRKAEDDGCPDFNERRKGRFPPSNSTRSRIIDFQYHRSSIGSGSGTRSRK